MPPTRDIAEINRTLSGAAAVDALKWCYAEFPHERIKLSTSFGAEGMVLVHMLVNLVKTPRVFFIDTGRNFQETYDIWQKVVEQYGVAIESYSPDPEDLAELQRQGGPNVFYQSKELRQRCCFVRKVKPLRRALADCDVWIAALRRSQSEARAETELFSHVEEHSVYKLCPLVNWSETDVWEYIRNNGVPYHPLYDEGYPSIGCAPCCRPIRPAEPLRASRWWWEQDAQKECGLHIEDGRVVRRKETPSWTI
jgi:phosphoadenosine phosphosulfate reductase